MKDFWNGLPTYWRDVAERVARTFVATFAMTYVAGIGPISDNTMLNELANADLAEKAVVAAVAAVGSLLISLVTKNVGPKGSVSVLTDVAPPSDQSPGDGPSFWS